MQGVIIRAFLVAPLMQWSHRGGISKTYIGDCKYNAEEQLACLKHGHTPITAEIIVCAVQSGYYYFRSLVYPVVILMANDRHCDRNDGYADDESSSYQLFHFFILTVGVQNRSTSVPAEFCV